MKHDTDKDVYIQSSNNVPSETQMSGTAPGSVVTTRDEIFDLKHQTLRTSPFRLTRSPGALIAALGKKTRSRARGRNEQPRFHIAGRNSDEQRVRTTPPISSFIDLKERTRVQNTCSLFFYQFTLSNIFTALLKNTDAIFVLQP